MARATHSQEFKDKAVMMYMDGKSSYAVAKEMGISHMSVQAWVKESGFEIRPRSSHADGTGKRQTLGVSLGEPKIPKREGGGINPLLLSMANGNDLSAFVGKEITKMTPREIYKFLELLNIKGRLVIEQEIILK